MGKLHAFLIVISQKVQVKKISLTTKTQTNMDQVALKATVHVQKKHQKRNERERVTRNVRGKKIGRKRTETLDSFFAPNYLIYIGLEIEQNRLQTYLSLY